MTFPRLAELIEHWHEHPPVHVSVARIARGLGWKPGPAPRLVTAQASQTPEMDNAEAVAWLTQNPKG